MNRSFLSLRGSYAYFSYNCSRKLNHFWQRNLCQNGGVFLKGVVRLFFYIWSRKLTFAVLVGTIKMYYFPKFYISRTFGISVICQKRRFGHILAVFSNCIGSAINRSRELKFYLVISLMDSHKFIAQNFIIL